MVDKWGVMVADNATNCDSACAALVQQLRPEEDKAGRRVRCFGHILNLAAQAFIYSKENEAFVSEVEQAVELSAHEQQAAKYEMTLWRQRGAFGKLHNVIKHIKASPQRQQQFKRIIKSVLIKRGENGGGSSHNDGGDGSVAGDVVESD